MASNEVPPSWISGRSELIIFELLDERIPEIIRVLTFGSAKSDCDALCIVLGELPSSLSPSNCIAMIAIIRSSLTSTQRAF